jgi:predicted type IV restriction endonuclease
MKDDLLKFVEQIRSNPNKVRAYDEAATKQGIILRLLHLLGWNTFDTDEVKPEYCIEGKRVDYALAINTRNEVFIEVKRPSQDLEHHEKQLLDYSFHLGVDIAVLTNGLLYWFYLPTAKGSWTKRRFYTIDLISQDPNEITSKFIDIIAKHNVVSGDSIKESRRIFESKLKKSIVYETLPDAWNKIIGEPESLLIDMLSETTERLCGYKPEETAVKRFLLQNLGQLRIKEIRMEPVPELPQPESMLAQIKPTYISTDRKLEIHLNSIHTPKTYGLIPVSKEIRHFFPGYKVSFILETDIGEIETRVTSAPQGTPIGKPDAGNYIQGRLKPWYQRHQSLTDGSTLTIEEIVAGKRYRLDIKK